MFKVQISKMPSKSFSIISQPFFAWVAIPWQVDIGYPNTTKLEKFLFCYIKLFFLIKEMI
ncbi:hypothetical protein D7Z94_12885 [Ulvibacterium marinum]|uniref:Uncharacterized protein n=1 Tax=Ulvibacterium marinum TaxID=2419782 RepID=A0A3B0C880_9FLAO|nr:hypothetical protein D7Z94_12885 [Ulvibacterium marinum]